MRGWFLGLLLVACGAAPDGVEPEQEAPRHERSEALEEAEVSPEPMEPAPVVEAPPREPCYWVAPEVAERWPGADDALSDAAGRWWRWYRVGDAGEECELSIVLRESGETCRVACAGPVMGDPKYIALRDGAPIVDGDECLDGQVQLADVLTHELGHVFGLHHGDGGVMVERRTCERVEPSLDEVRRVNLCDADGPMAGAACPE